MLYVHAVLIALIIGAVAYATIKAIHAHFGNIDNELELVGSLVAGAILEDNGLQDVFVRRQGEGLASRYDRLSRTLLLGADAYSKASVAAAAVAAHECGHAIQCRKHAQMMQVAESLNSLAVFCSALWPLPFALGLLLRTDALLAMGLALLFLAFLLQAGLLLVEVGASRHGMVCLKELNLKYRGAACTGAVAAGYQAVLWASALTYALTVPFAGVALLLRWLWHAMARE